MTEPTPSTQTKLCSNKECAKTGELQPYSNFYNHPKSKDGKTAWCIPCMKASSAKHQHSAKGRKTRRTYAKRHADSDQTRARRHVHDCVKKGYIKKPDHCFRCKRHTKECGTLEFHHTKDYSDPKNWLVGEWLCRTPCHEQADYEAGTQKHIKNRTPGDTSDPTS